MKLCKTCDCVDALHVKQNLFLCVKCIPNNKQVYHSVYNKITNYDLTLLTLIEKWKKQRQQCAICFKPVPLFEICVDHDHNSNKVRGLLCRTCNIGFTV